jgi:hypothetical protein
VNVVPALRKSLRGSSLLGKHHHARRPMNSSSRASSRSNGRLAAALIKHCSDRLFRRQSKRSSRTKSVEPNQPKLANRRAWPRHGPRPPWCACHQRGALLDRGGARYGRPDLIVRMILDQCATTAEAVAKLRQLPHAMYCNYSLLDANGIASVVEAGPWVIAARIGAWLAYTNHFQSALLRALNHRRFAAHSKWRLPPLESWASGGLN